MSIKHILTIGVLGLASCGRSTPFAVTSSDGALRVAGSSVRNISIPGELFDFVFTDSNPSLVASRMSIEAGHERLNLPERMAKRIAKPGEMQPVSHTISGGSGSVVIRGGDGAGGMTLTMTFRDGSLVRAEAVTVASDIPKVVWP